MSLHVLSHPWKVQDLEDGPLVHISDQDLNVETIAVLTDEFFELAQESGQPTLYLDFEQVNVLPSLVAGKLLALGRELQEVGKSLILHNLKAQARRMLCPQEQDNRLPHPNL